MTRFISLISLSLLLSSCFILEEYENAATAESESAKKERQDVIQDSIIAYLQSQSYNKQEYIPYTFGSLYSNKPREIVELEQLHQIKAELPTMQTRYGDKFDSITKANDQEIHSKSEEIREKHLYTTYDLTHLYCIKKENNEIKLIESNFKTYPNNVIKDAEIIFSTSLNSKEYELFEHYIHQDPLIFDNDYSYQKHLNANTYEKLNQSMIEAQPDRKADLLKTILKKVAFYQKNNGFDPEVFTNYLISEWTKNPSLDITIEKVVKVSPLKLIKEQSKTGDSIPKESLLGFKKFVLVRVKTNDPLESEFPLYFEFDENHVLMGVLPVEGEYQKYFE